MQLTIYGETPSKKNSKSLVFRGGRAFIFSGKTYKAWHTKQKRALQGGVKLKDITEVGIVLYAGTRRKGDLTNKAESVMDLLVDCGIIEDDNWFEVPKISLQFGGVDKLSPRAEVTIQTK